ncbi:MAG: DMT family transporter [Myxococcales bacterium]|nr:MAG: DMT family transporter [Myxococcales bacterium]
MTNLPRAALFMVGAALLFALMSVMVKLLSHSLPNAVVVLLRSGLSLVVLLPVVARRGRAELRTRRLKEHLIRGAVGMGGMYCFFFTISQLGLAEAMLLNYSLPLFIPLVERAWLGEPTPRGVWKPLALGMLGLLLILKPGMALFRPAALVGVVGALFAATAQVGVRRLTLSESVTKIVFYFSISSTLIALGPAALVWVTPSVAAVPLIIAMVAAGTLAQLMMTRAYQLAPAAQVGPFIYGSVAFAACFDWLIFEHRPDALGAAGTAIVVVAGVLALRRRR